MLRKILPMILLILAPALAVNAQTNVERTQMDEQKILVVYFSYSGNTRTVAEKVNVLPPFFGPKSKLVFL